MTSRSEIVFFDVETTIPSRSGQGYALLEFGSILVCPQKLIELDYYSTLVRPNNPSLISPASVRCNGITADAVASAPTFEQIADKVFDILHGRIWAGHNIVRFDCVRIREAFAGINRPPPESKGTIDSLTLLTQKFGRRAGNMKMATLATYFGLGQQTHRSLDDVRMNLEVLKYCATVLFLESSLPDILAINSGSPNANASHINGIANNSGSPNATASHINGIGSTVGQSPLPSFNISQSNGSNPSPSNRVIADNYPVVSLMTPGTCDDIVNLVESSMAQPDSFDMGPLVGGIERPDDNMEEESPSQPPSAIASDPFSGDTHFLEPDEVSIPSITAVLVPFYRGTQTIQIRHKDFASHLCCKKLKVRFGISTKFVDYAGRPRLSFVVDASPSMCQVLDACDNLAQRLSLDSGSTSDWRPVVVRKSGFVNSPSVRLHLPTVMDGSRARWSTEIYQKESSSNTQRLVFNRYDVAELDACLIPGTSVDAYFSLDPYDYQQSAGIRLVAKKLIVHSN